MHDPWLFAIALLLGTHHAPAIGWPEHVHRCIAPPDAEPDLVLPPLPPEPSRLKPVEVDTLAKLAIDPGVTARDLAAAVGVSKTSAARAAGAAGSQRRGNSRLNTERSGERQRKRHQGRKLIAPPYTSRTRMRRPRWIG